MYSTHIYNKYTKRILYNIHTHTISTHTYMYVYDKHHIHYYYATHTTNPTNHLISLYKFLLTHAIMI